MEAADFLRKLVQAMLTGNGVQFTARKQDIWDSEHIIDRVCNEHGIEPRLTKVNHPWTNGQVERTNRTIKDATVKRHRHDTHDQLRAHLQLFVGACNHAQRLKTLRGFTPAECIHQTWTKQPSDPGSTRYTSPRDHTVWRYRGITSGAIMGSQHEPFPTPPPRRDPGMPGSRHQALPAQQLDGRAA